MLPETTRGSHGICSWKAFFRPILTQWEQAFWYLSYGHFHLGLNVCLHVLFYVGKKVKEISQQVTSIHRNLQDIR